MNSRIQFLALTIALAAAPAAQAAYNFTFIPASQWGTSDAALGLSPVAVVENFENTALIAGLTAQVQNSSSGSYGPTNTLPHTFNPNSDDCCGLAFVGANWDGSRVLLNTGDNQSADYGSATAWGDVIFGIAAGATQIGLSMQQVSSQGLTFTINDSTFISLASIPGYQFLNEGRTGYFRIDVVGNSAPITTFKIDGVAPDGWAVDHLAVTAVPEPPIFVLLAVGVALITALKRSHRAA